MKPVIICCLLLCSNLFPSRSIQQYDATTRSGDIVWIDSRISAGSYQSAPILANDVQTVVIPLKRAGNLIIMDALIDSVYGNLILDTGAEGIVLNSVYFRQSRKSAGYLAGGITGSVGTVTNSRISQLQISELQLKNLNVNISDLGHIENARNIKILGFFGLNLINDFEVVLDLRNNLLELHRTDKVGNRFNGKSSIQKFDMIFPVIVSSDVLFIEAIINQRKLSFCLDTGAETNVLSSNLPGKVLGTVDIVRRSTLRGVGSQNIEVVYGIMNDFYLGKIPVRGMNTIITNLGAMGGFYKMNIDGMLGCDFFEKGVFQINLKKKAIGINFYKEDKK